MSRIPRVFLATALIVFCALAPAPALAQRSEASEASVKAAFLYKFANYVEWAPAAFAADDAPFVIAVIGSEEVATELAKIVPGRHVAGHPVMVKKLREGDPVRGAQFVFIGRIEASRMQALLRSAQQQGVLAVTESDKGLESGAAINFVVVEDRVGFEVSLDSADKTGHRISSRMLTVARRVIPKAP